MRRHEISDEGRDRIEHLLLGRSGGWVAARWSIASLSMRFGKWPRRRWRGAIVPSDWEVGHRLPSLQRMEQEAGLDEDIRGTSRSGFGVANAG